MITLDDLTQEILNYDVETAQQSLVAALEQNDIDGAAETVQWIAAFAALVELLDTVRPTYEAEFIALQQKHLDGLRANYASMGLP